MPKLWVTIYIDICCDMQGQLAHGSAAGAGKDIYQLALPTHVNEPLTVLQRRAEAFHSSELLDKVTPFPVYDMQLFAPCTIALVRGAHTRACWAASIPVHVQLCAFCLPLPCKCCGALQKMIMPVDGPASKLNLRVLLLVNQAALLPPQSVERLLHVSAFVVSIYNTLQRTDAPFESLGNATYELVYPEKGLRMIMERVRCMRPVSSQTLNPKP